MKLFLCLVATLFTTSLQAQIYRVYGKVLSKDLNEPFAEAIVSSQATNALAYTNEEGYFELSLSKGRHKLWAFSLGMRSTAVEIDLAQDTALDFYLEELSSYLGEVEIVATKRTMGITRLKAVDGFGIYEAKKNEVIVL
ncbi:MAG: carboxypeptidase-like regulatory domain-containing protein, partial [Bacteroidota bacterium]